MYRFHRSETVQKRIYAYLNDVPELKSKVYLNNSGETDRTKFVNEHNVEFRTDSIARQIGYGIQKSIKYKKGTKRGRHLT